MNSYQAPAAQEYGGDEINALVLDPGSYTIRAGFAGEDAPKSVVPSFYGTIAASDPDSQPQYLFGENAIHNPTSGMQIRNPFNADSVVEDWDVAAKLFEYSITSRLTGVRPTPANKNGLNTDPKEENGAEGGDGDGDVAMEGTEEQEKPMAEHPLLMTEPAWNPVKNREKSIEIAMEDWGVPAFWMGKTGMLAAFASGKPNALVIDIGANTTSVTPIHEGYVLKKGIQKSHLAGNFISNQIRLQFTQMTPPVPLVPHYMVKSKQPVDAGQPSNATYVQYATPPSASFRLNEEERVLTSFKESMVQVWQGPGKLEATDALNHQANVDAAKSLPARPFELPDGWNQVFGLERFKIAEGLFDHKAALIDPQNAAATPEHKQTLAQLVNASLNAVDMEARPTLLGNIVLTGGGSQIEKVADRLHAELSAMFPNPRVRVHASNVSTDRKYGAWLGGSVLASLGTFHQTWISKKEYDEVGANVVEKRCR